MKRLRWLAGFAAAAAVANLGWVWLQRHEAVLRMERRLTARKTVEGASLRTDSSTRVRITQFYATAGEITDAEHSTVCYGVENARAVRMEPPVENLTPTLTRCFWVEPKQDTTYRLIAEGADGSEASAEFRLHVKPAPPSILFVAVSAREIVRGDALTVCYGVDRAQSVRLEPVGMALPPVKRNCVRLYPKGSMKWTLVASGAGGATDRERFEVAVK